jgi:hypothetical protein
MTHASTDLPHHRILEYRLLIHWKGAGIGMELPDIVGAAVKLLEFRGSAASCKGSSLRAWRHTVLLSVSRLSGQPAVNSTTDACTARPLHDHMHYKRHENDGKRHGRRIHQCLRYSISIALFLGVLVSILEVQAI